MVTLAPPIPPGTLDAKGFQAWLVRLGLEAFERAAGNAALKAPLRASLDGTMTAEATREMLRGEMEKALHERMAQAATVFDCDVAAARIDATQRLAQAAAVVRDIAKVLRGEIPDATEIHTSLLLVAEGLEQAR